MTLNRVDQGFDDVVEALRDCSVIRLGD